MNKKSLWWIIPLSILVGLGIGIWFGYDLGFEVGYQTFGNQLNLPSLG